MSIYVDDYLVMEKKKNSAKTKLSRNKKKTSTKTNIITITDDLNETCEFRKPEKILSKTSTEKIPGNSKEKISRKSAKSESECQTENSKCPACLLVIHNNLQCHLQTCLKARFGRNGALKKEGTTSNTSNKSDTENHNEENSLCHLEDKTQDLIEKNQNEQLEDNSPLDLDVDFCHICQKDISKLNSQRKLQHVNKCIDQGEEKQRQQEEEKRALELAKTAVLDCPMCGKPFKTDSGRKNHLKKCAFSLGVKTEQMIKLVKKQEEEHHLKLAAGILPVNSRKQTKKSDSGTSVKNKRAIKEPKNKLDEDIQVAMAISSSLTEEQSHQEGPVTGKLSASSSNKETKKGKKKKGQDDQPVLLMLPDDEKQKRMENKVMSVLIPQDEDEEIENTPPSLQKSVLQEKYQADLIDAPGLWLRSQLQEIILDKLNNKDIFYVQTLMPPVEESKVIAGSKVRRMSEIPGRRKSVKVPCSTQKETFSAHSMGTPDEDHSSEVMMISTQTAVVLAELAADEEEQENNTNSPSCSGFCPEKFIKIQETMQDQAAKELKNSFLKLLETPTNSDLQIISLDGRHDVHQTIIMCRCPELCKMAEGPLVHLEEFSSDVVSSVLMYIYAGEITVTPTMLESALELAERLKLKELVEVYEQIKSQISMETDDPDTEDTEVSGNHLERRTSEIDSLLKEIMDDSDEDIETKTDGLNTETGHLYSDEDDMTARKDIGEKIDGYISEEDYYDIMCSQKQKLQKVSKENQKKKNEESVYDNFNKSLSDHDFKGCHVNHDNHYTSKDINKISTNTCLRKEDNTCTDETKDNKTGFHGCNDNASFNETVNVVDKKEIEVLDLNTSQKLQKSNKNQKLKCQKTSKVRTRKDCASPDVFLDVKETSIVYETEELVIFSQSESDGSPKHSIDQDMNKFSKHSGDTENGKCEDESIKFIDPHTKCLGEYGKPEGNTFLEEDEENLSSSISVSEHAVIICSDNSNDSITQTNLSTYDKPLEKQKNIYHDDRNVLESTRINPTSSISDKHTNRIDELSIIKSQLSSKSVTTPPSSSRSPKTRNFSQSSSISESLDATLNRRLDSSSTDLFASPPEHGLPSKNSDSLMKANNSLCQYSPKNYDHDNARELVSDNILNTLSSPYDLSPENSGSSFIENLCENRNIDEVDKKIGKGEKNLVVSAVDEEIRTAENGFSSSESESSISLRSHKKKTLDEGSTSLSLSQKSLDKSVKHRKRKKMDTASSSGEDDDSQNKSLFFKKTKLSNSPCDTDHDDGAVGLFDSSSSSVSPRISRLSSPNNKIKSPRNKTSNNDFQNIVNKQKSNEMGVSEIDTINGMYKKEQCQTEDDVEIVSDNFEELSQRNSEESQTRSPIFRVKEKKKFLFKKRKQLTNFQTLEAEKDCVVEDDNEMQVNNENLHLSQSDNKNITEEELNTGCQPEGDTVDDVWEGFDDCGGVMFGGDCDIDTPVTCDMDSSISNNTDTTSRSNTKMNIDTTSQSNTEINIDTTSRSNTEINIDTTSRSNTEINITEDRNRSVLKDREKRFEKCLDHVQDDDENDKHVEEADVTEFGNDSFMWKDDNAPFECEDGFTEEAVEEDTKNLCNGKKSKDNFKTPSVARSRSNKQWIPPSPFTPMPEYDKMATPILKKEVQKYGVKPVGKKRNILLLKDIYKQTHQYETDSDYEDDNEIQTNKDVSYVKTNHKNTIKSRPGACSSTGVKSTSSVRKTTVIQPDVVVEDESLSSSDDTNCSQESLQSDMVEESFLQVPYDDDDIPQSQMTSGTDLSMKLLDFVHSRPDIKVRILMYEPLELDWLKKEIKDSGIKCSMEKVMEFLDEKCITFTMKNRRQEKANKKRRGRGKKKTDIEKEGKK